MLLSLKELHQPRVWRKARFDTLKQKIAREWDRRRRVNEVGYIALHDVKEILRAYNEIKPLLFEGYKQDFPEYPRTQKLIYCWLRQNAILFDKMRDIPTRNIWLDLQNCFALLSKKELLEVNKYGIVQ